MQLELVRYESDQIEKQVTAKAAEVASLQSNIDMARTRLVQQEQEAGDLEKKIAAAKADSSAARRKK
jgi:predicted  nucleic acid-binding Zn-ribbon protein